MVGIEYLHVTSQQVLTDLSYNDLAQIVIARLSIAVTGGGFFIVLHLWMYECSVSEIQPDQNVRI